MSRAHGTIALQERQGIFRGINVQHLIYNTGGEGMQTAFLRPSPLALIVNALNGAADIPQQDFALCIANGVPPYSTRAGHAALVPLQP